MEISVIIILILLIIYVFVSIFRESHQRKWYKRGYINAANKYDEKYADDIYYNNRETHCSEANREFHKEYGLHYD